MATPGSVDIVPPERIPPAEPGQTVFCDFDERGMPALGCLERALRRDSVTDIVAGVSSKYAKLHPEILAQPIRAVMVRPYDSGALRRALQDSSRRRFFLSATERELVGAMIEATTTVIGGYDPSTRLCGMWTTDRPSPHGEIGGAMSLTGDLCSEAILIMYNETARQLVARLTGGSPDELNSSDAHDLVGEMVNQVCGFGMTMLSRQQRYIRITVPTLFRCDRLPDEVERCANFLTLLFRGSERYFSFQLGFPAGSQLSSSAEGQTSVSS